MDWNKIYFGKLGSFKFEGKMNHTDLKNCLMKMDNKYVWKFEGNQVQIRVNALYPKLECELEKSGENMIMHARIKMHKYYFIHWILWFFGLLVGTILFLFDFFNDLSFFVLVPISILILIVNGLKNVAKASEMKRELFRVLSGC